MGEKANKPAGPVKKIFVGYRTRLVAGAEGVAPEFSAPSNYKDPNKIAGYVEEKRQAFMANAANVPYTGTFDEVFLIDPNSPDEGHPERTKLKALQFKHHPPEDGKPLVSVRVRNYLTKNYPKAWTHDTHKRVGPEVILVGFNLRPFLKMLGLECSLPTVNRPCPLGLWYGNSDHRDIGEAVCPAEFAGVPVSYVLQQRRPTEPDAAAKWDEMTKGWVGPGVSPYHDVQIAIELASQLGFLDG